MTREQEIYIRGLIELYKTTIEVIEKKMENLPVNNTSRELYGQLKAYELVISDLENVLKI